jgi:hypothetical protein
MPMMMAFGSGADLAQPPLVLGWERVAKGQVDTLTRGADGFFSSARRSGRRA